MDHIEDKEFSLQLLRRATVVVEQNINLEKELANARTESGVLEKELEQSNLRVAQLEHALSQQRKESEVLRLAANGRKNIRYHDHGCQAVTDATTALSSNHLQACPVVPLKKTAVSVAIQTEQIEGPQTPLKKQPQPAIRTLPRARPLSHNEPQTQTRPQPATLPRTRIARPALPVASTSRNPTSNAGNTVITAPLPASREKVLADYAHIKLPQEANEEYTICFGRAQVSNALGGGQQTLIGNIATQKPLAVRHNITKCLFPLRDLNVWLPERPGEHGYMFVGLRGKGGDHAQFMEDNPPQRSLFIATGKETRYYGEYIARRSPELDLTVEEWQALPEQFKSGPNAYCDLTLKKRECGNYDNFRKNAVRYRAEIIRIRQDYDSGNLRVPCVALQCVGYKENLVSDLLAFVSPNRKEQKSTGAEQSESRPVAQTSLRLGKRKRPSTDEGDAIETPDAISTPMEASPYALRRSKRRPIERELGSPYVPSRESTPFSFNNDQDSNFDFSEFLQQTFD